jgi:hypothetical protein
MEARILYSKRSAIFVSLVFVLLLSLVIAEPVSAPSANPPGWPGAVPSDNYVAVVPGGTFLLRGTVTFDQPSAGWFSWDMVWWHYGNADENLTVENMSVYWISGPENGNPVENVIMMDFELKDGHRVHISDNGDGIAPNGTFRVDVWLRAASGDGTPHKLDNQWIYFAFDQVTLFEPDPKGVPAGPIYVDVVNWTGTATFELENLYKVGLEKDIQLGLGSKLVVKFYKYDNTFQAESVIDNITPPYPCFIKEKENVPHPLGKPVEKFTLALTTDNTENVI